MTLKEYMEASNLDDEALAALIGDCSAHAVKKWRYGERLPRPEQMRRIYEITHGLVAPNDFVGVEPSPRARPLAGGGVGAEPAGANR